jgi:ferrous iron transport protein B
MAKNITIAGNPNCGKTAIFNQLTGLNQQVSNLAGTTVEIQRGRYKYNEDLYHITDLPGAYSIYGETIDQKEAIKELLDTVTEIDLIVYVCDVQQLYRNLLFFAQLSSLKTPILVVLNMYDTLTLDDDVLSNLQNQLGIEVIPFSARHPQRYASLKDKIKEHCKGKTCKYFEDIYPNNASVLEGKERANKTIQAYQKIAKLLSVQNKKDISPKNLGLQKLDKVLMHPILGIFIFAFVLYLIFQTLFAVAEYPMNWIDQFFLFLSQSANSILPTDSLISSLVIDGIIPGVGGVLIFIPQIALLFILLGILEDTGYVSRVSYLLNSILSKFGLGGKSIIPMIGGFACAIPAIMSARTIENSKQRLITMMVTPLMTCSARLPVYTILIGLMAVNFGGFWSDQRGVVFFIMYMLGVIASLIFALVFKAFIKTNERSYFIQEIPSYRKPILSNILKNTWQKTLQFITSAGKIIFIVSLLLWFLASFGPTERRAEIVQKYDAMENNSAKIEQKNAELLENSYAGILGKSIEPVIEPLGYDWKIGVALVTSFAAREVFVGTISTIFALESEKEDLIIDRLRNAKRSNGQPLFSMATILSLLIFYAFALQCVSTLAVMRKETHGWKWPIIQFCYMTLLAYLSALITYQSLV